MKRINFWLLPDTHLGHTKLNILHRKAGFEDIIFNNLEKLPKRDIIVHLGDFIFKKHGYLDKWLEIVADRTVWLIRGNHDNETMGWYLTHGFNFVADEIKLDIYGHTVLLSHKPVDRNDFDICIHGHLHGCDRHTECKRNKRNVSLDIEGHFHPHRLQHVVQKYFDNKE